MMRKPILLAGLLGLASICQAKDNDPETAGAPTVAGATRAAKAHVRSFMEGKFKTMEKTYAAQVELLPGHEMLKAEYGLAGANGRKEGLTTDRAKLIAAIDKAFEGRPVVAPEIIDQVFKLFTFQVLETELGDCAIDPPDPVGTPDGKLHFSMKKGDLLFRVGPKKGDFLLFQFRPVNGTWKVVGEYLD